MKELLKVEPGPLGELITFNWHIIDICQLKCPYCCSVDFNKNTWQETKVEELVLRRLSTLTKPFQVDLTGGEPTLHPKLLMILDTLEKNPNCKIIDLHTNFKKKNEFYLNLDSKKYTKVNLVVSYHSHAFESNEFSDKIIDLNSKLKYLKLDTNINLTTDKQFWNHLKETINLLKSNGINTHTNTLNPTSAFNPNYDKDFNIFFKDELKEVFTNNFIHKFSDGSIENINETNIRINNISYKGMLCNQKHFRIYLKGEIINSCTHITYNKMSLKDIGETIICPLSKCDTAFKYHYQKVKK